MNYCENCYCAFDQARCPLCGTKRFRAVQEEDFCLLTEDSTSACESLANTLREHGVTCSTVPYGTGLESHVALPLSQYRLYVPYRFLEYARQSLQAIEDHEIESLRNYFLECSHLLHIEPKAEKKIRKKMKLSQTQDFLAYCIDIIRSAQVIGDGGPLTNGGHYIYCYAENAILAFDSESFEILTLTKR